MEASVVRSWSREDTFDVARLLHSSQPAGSGILEDENYLGMEYMDVHMEA